MKLKHLFVYMLLLFIVMASLWMSGLFYFISIIPRSVYNTTQTTDAIVVLTGGSDRVEEGMGLLERQMAPLLFISGVNEEVKPEELIAHTKLSEDYKDRVILGYLADTTRENGLEVADWTLRKDINSIRLVTSNYHMPRSLLNIRIHRPHLTVVPHPVVPDHVKLEGWWQYPGTRNLLVNEYHKWIATWLQTKGIKIPVK